MMRLLAQPSTWPQLQELRFPLWMTKVEHVEAVLKSKKRFRHLSLYSEHVVASRLVPIRTFEIENDSFCSFINALVEHQNMSIAHLDLIGVDIADASVLSLTNCFNLSFLNISCFKLTDISLGYLKVCFL